MSSISEDTDPSENRAVARAATAVPSPNRVTFNRLELNRILNLYGRMVAAVSYTHLTLPTIYSV